MKRPRGLGRLAAHAKRLANIPLCELVFLFESWISLSHDPGRPARKRIYTNPRTFWLFLWQVLSEDPACRRAVLKARAWLGLAMVDEDKEKDAEVKTSAFCQARKRLPDPWLADIHRQVGEGLETTAGKFWRWRGRVVKVMDGSSVQLPDTPDNQAAYPQPTSQKPGCGFPVARLTAMFSLATGRLIEWEYDALTVGERTLARRLWDFFQPGDVALNDRGFCGFAEFYELQQRGVDSVSRKHQRLGPSLQTVRKLGLNDRLAIWTRSAHPSAGYDRETWKALPSTLRVREVFVQIEIPGFRTQSVYILTTLLDARRYCAEDLADLYRRRWKVELFLRDLKTTMGMEMLRSRSPLMIRKELRMFAIGYNLVRLEMARAAVEYGVALDRISFKGTIQTILETAPTLAAAGSQRERDRLHKRMLRTIAKDLLPNRPNRVEPRAVKRRPKEYQLLNKPRRQFIEIPHRNKYQAAVQ